MPSACAGWVRVYASRSTSGASRTTTRAEHSAVGAGRFGSAASEAFALPYALAVLRRRRRRDMRTLYTNDGTDLHRGASVSPRYPGLKLLYALPLQRAFVSVRARDRGDVRCPA